MLTQIQYRILRKIAPVENRLTEISAFEGKSKLRVSLGDKLLKEVEGKTVIDFGCGEGEATLDLLRFGALKAEGIDIRSSVLEAASARAAAAGLASRCSFSTEAKEAADVIVSLDAFEHFGDPAQILSTMARLIKPGGAVLTSFGPTWYHPLGGHLFSVFPWAHLLFSEAALLKWRSGIRTDGATRFSEVEGGLNQMTISRFEEFVAGSGFELASLETVPIRKLKPLHCRLTREFTTASVRARLVQKA